jgi:hypothetical protein
MSTRGRNRPARGTDSSTDSNVGAPSSDMPGIRAVRSEVGGLRCAIPTHGHLAGTRAHKHKRTGKPTDRSG